MFQPLYKKQRWETHTVILKYLFPSWTTPPPLLYLIQAHSWSVSPSVLHAALEYIYVSLWHTRNISHIGNYSPCNSVNSEVVPWRCSNRSTRAAKFQVSDHRKWFSFLSAMASSPSHTHADHDMCLLSRLWPRIEKLYFHPYLPHKPFKSELRCGKGQRIFLSTMGRIQERSLALVSHARLF